LGDEDSWTKVASDACLSLKTPIWSQISTYLELGGGGGGGAGGEHPAVDDSSTSVGERIVLNLLEHTQSVLAALLLVNTTGRESSFGMFPLKDWDHGLGQGGGFGAGGIDV
jgi:hypothetical protein